jgi:endo-1,4-beta-D-glucanase Y
MVYRYLLALPCLLLAACASAGSDNSGAAGTSGGAGTNGGAGTSGAGAGFGMGGPFNFPQAKKSGACLLTTVSNASADTMTAYTAWKNAFVVPGAGPDGAAAGMRVQRDSNTSNDTVSEGIGYGMLAAVYVGDRATFDGLWTYAQSHFDAVGLMNWHINSTGSIASGGTGSASDGDEDMAFALLMASDQWSSTTYLNAAQTLINNILYNSVANDGTLKPGDAWGSTTMNYPDYFSPAYYRAFAKATDNAQWLNPVVERGYAILATQSNSNGLLPDSTMSANTAPTSGTYGYDACRTPWRIGMDYCFNGELRAQAYLTKIGTFFNGITAANIGDGYSVASSAATSNSHNMAFIGPAGVAGMEGFQTLVDGAFTFGNNNSGNSGALYFQRSLGVISMLMVSGNLLDYSQLQ